MVHPKYTNRLFRISLPIILPVLKRNRARLCILLSISILLGFLPTIKSGIESNFLTEADDILFHDTPDTSRSMAFSSILHHRFDPEAEDSGFFESMPDLFTNGFQLWHILLIYPLAILITFLFEYVTERLKTYLSQNIFITIREAGFKKALCTLPYEMPKVFNVSGNIASSIQMGAGNISAVYNFIVSAIQYVLLLATSCIVLFTTAWIFGVFFLVVLALQVLLSIRRANKLKGDRNKLDLDRNNLAAHTTAFLSKKEIILAFEQEERYNQKMTRLTRDFAKLVRSLDIRNFLYNNSSRIINEIERFLIPLAVLIFVMCIDRSATIGIGGMFFLIVLYSRLSAPILGLLSQYDSLKENEAVSNSLLDLLAVSNQVLTTPKLKAPVEEESAVIFNHVSFGYDRKSESLKNCSFRIPKNKTTIILGPSGSGKSSIAKIILGFWRITEGEVFFMGQPLSSYTDKEIRMFSSYISQGDYIVEDTIRDNLNWGWNNSVITDDMMMVALFKVKLVDHINEISILDKYTRDLSGGEQQRLSLARVVLDNSPMLILDEPLTGVDVYTIRDILPSFREILKYQNRTVILISHKLSFVNSADYVILLGSEGNVVEEGRPEDLIRDENSILHDLYRVAMKELSLNE